MSSTASALFTPEPRHLVVHDLNRRMLHRLESLSDSALQVVLEDSLYSERKRLDSQKGDHPENEILDQLAKSLVRGNRGEQTKRALQLTEIWIEEIHGHFDPKVYGFATRLLPTALTSLLTSRAHDANSPTNKRLRVSGNTKLLQTLADEATLILAPTHLSNLDSPLIGLALYLAGLPPFVYGAGLNLFTNPVMSFFMSRLGAYTVDRTKKAPLYKMVLKEYSIHCLTTHHHSLFFPGGTRSRSGEVEQSVKKGLLGTGVTAWQELLEKNHPKSEVYVVPLTLSCQLVLEANTLIQDHLAEFGKQRYIITDDEFSRPRTIAGFARRVLDLDASTVAHFGDPLDCLGNPVSADKSERDEQAKQRRQFVCNRDGDVVRDPQRDHVYTNRLADALVRAFPRGVHVMPTHLAAYAAWKILEEKVQSKDPFRVIRLVSHERVLERKELVARIDSMLAMLREGAARGDWNLALPNSAEQILDDAIDRFSRYHRTKALADDSDWVVVDDPKLCLYYRNRLTFLQDVSEQS